MRQCGIVSDICYLDHITDDAHPENRKRLEVVYPILEQTPAASRLQAIDSRLAERSEILRVHTPEYLDRIAATAGRDRTVLTPDTWTSPGSFEAARRASGGFFQAISAVMDGTVDNAFALVRPPGHHAEKSRAVGYCLFNHVALGARFAADHYGIDKILIVDWDVHHGNGTQHAFEEDETVFFFSSHQFPHFPGTGHFTEIGRGKGEGFTMNLALPKGYGDAEYVALYERVLPAVAEEFGPDLILVSAGFDTHSLDMLGGMQMTEDGFSGLTRCLMKVADRCCGGRLALVLEGGYHLETLPLCVDRVLQELTDTSVTRLDHWLETADRKKIDYALSRCRHVHRPFWKNLQAA
jgi:acetoin utilization deacetylase AcuC-like enzyme